MGTNFTWKEVWESDWKYLNIPLKSLSIKNLDFLIFFLRKEGFTLSHNSMKAGKSTFLNIKKVAKQLSYGYCYIEYNMTPKEKEYSRIITLFQFPPSTSGIIKVNNSQRIRQYFRNFGYELSFNNDKERKHFAWWYEQSHNKNCTFFTAYPENHKGYVNYDTWWKVQSNRGFFPSGGSVIYTGSASKIIKALEKSGLIFSPEDYKGTSGDNWIISWDEQNWWYDHGGDPKVAFNSVEEFYTLWSGVRNKISKNINIQQGFPKCTLTPTAYIQGKPTNEWIKKVGQFMRPPSLSFSDIGKEFQKLQEENKLTSFEEEVINIKLKDMSFIKDRVPKF